MIPSLERNKNAVWALLIASATVILLVTTSRPGAIDRSPSTEVSPVEESPPVVSLPEVEPAPSTSIEAGGPSSITGDASLSTATEAATLSPSQEAAVVARARLELQRVTVYDSSYLPISSYPMGDIPETRGACTDVVVRSLRAIGFDLQELVHEDVLRDMPAYGTTYADTNIDHRRLSTMLTFFDRNALVLTTDLHDKDAWRAGDVVFMSWQWKRGAPPEHVGLLSDAIGPRGLPLVIENGGPRPVEQDSLGHTKIVGHFRAVARALTRP